MSVIDAQHEIQNHSLAFFIVPQTSLLLLSTPPMMHALLPFLALGLAAAADIDTEGLPNTGLDISSWTTGVAPSIDDIVNLHDIQIAAKNTLSARNYAYYRTAALDEVTYQANLMNWAKIRLNGYSFQDTSTINLKTTMLGYEFDSPFVCAWLWGYRPGTLTPQSLSLQQRKLAELMMVPRVI